MDRQQAARLISTTFQNPFERSRFINFVSDLLNRIEDAPFVYKGNYIPDAFAQYVSTLERIGKYSDGEHSVDVLIVTLKKDTSIERARTMQRNFIARYLNGSRGGTLKDAALVAFVAPDSPDWRFSLIKMEYRIEQGGNGRVKVKEEFTPARRWSFLVGANEDSHTAQSRLAPILANDEHNPALKELEEAFNIERVTKEFFEEYRNLFLWVKEELDRIVQAEAKIRRDFESKQVSTVDFAKKLLGQIVFLYFLQKKGWFGVTRDGQWGTGSRQFLRELFEKKHSGYDNFFNDILEPLFYVALCQDRSYIDDYYDKLNCRIPFLNGGLFDPINGYDWVHTDIMLPDQVFSNKVITKKGDIGNGILDVFDRYNFTVKEDEPLEKEVAVDPEMLGKIFERLGAITPDKFDEWAAAVRSGNTAKENQANKKLGVYYTPREIVHYMCQQSLIYYLCRELGSNPPVYQEFGIDQTQFVGNEVEIGQLNLMSQQGGVTKADIETLVCHSEGVIENEANVVKLGKETITYRHRLPESIRMQAARIDQKLASIKVLDPAIGSGAFPVGMMTEIVKLRMVLSMFIDDNKTPYDYKRHCIQNSLYGVDIDCGAVEIAKLRLWLSLVVDEEDIKQIKPLPNLDYKVVCGNSLESVEARLEHSKAFMELETLKKRYFDETIPGQKGKEKARIEELIRSLTGNKARFDYKIFFSEAFDHKGGFDVVIANPPYVHSGSIKEFKDNLKKEFSTFFCGTADLYTYFYKRGIGVLKSGGHLCFISSNKFMRGSYGKNLRMLLTSEATPRVVIDFGDLPIFEATTYPSIVLVEKKRPTKDEKALAATFTEESQLECPEKTFLEKGFAMPVKALKAEGWTLEEPKILALMEKLRKAGTPLSQYVNGRFYYGIKTGLNEAFVIDDATRAKLIAEDPKSAELIKPWLRGRDIKKWKTEWAGLYLITIASSANEEWPWSKEKSQKNARSLFDRAYPAIHHHLSQWEKKLQKRDDQGQFWWELRSCAYYDAFGTQKITWGNLATEPKFAIDFSQNYVSAPAVVMPTKDVYLLAILNSPICEWLIGQQAATRSGGFLEYKPMYVGQIPIFPASSVQKTAITSLVTRILANPESPFVLRIEAEMNRLVYQLYNLTLEEIALVESGHGVG